MLPLLSFSHSTWGSMLYNSIYREGGVLGASPLLVPRFGSQSETSASLCKIPGKSERKTPNIRYRSLYYICYFLRLLLTIKSAENI